jgi:hypothetical protein
MLPKELQNLILEYAGIIKFRNGMFINQLNKDDLKYNLIKIYLENKNNLILQLPNTGYCFDGIINDNGCGIMYDYNWFGLGITLFTFYKKINNTFWYKYTDFIYKFLNLQHNDLIIISTFKLK